MKFLSSAKINLNLEVNSEIKQLLKVTKESLYNGIEMAVAGNRIGDISYAIQKYAESFGYGVVRWSHTVCFGCGPYTSIVLAKTKFLKLGISLETSMRFTLPT